MTAPEPPAVYWCARTGELATDYTAGMVYLDEHHRPPDDAVRLVPESCEHDGPCDDLAECQSCYTAGCLAEYDQLRGAVAALLRRCDERDEGDPNATYHGWMLTTEVRALLGGADNNNEGERRG